MLLSTFTLVACKEDNKAGDVAKKTETILSAFSTDGYISMNIDIEKVRDHSIPREQDKSYIFESVYYKYLTMSSSLFFNVYKRYGFSDNAFKKFSKKQNETLLLYLNDVNNSLKNLEHSIDIYESSNGNLLYLEVVNNFNIAIDRMYKLNYYFADVYFASVKLNIQKVTNIDEMGSLLNDYLLYISCYMSRVPFGYELINFVYANPFGDMTTWLNKSIYTIETLDILSVMVSRIQQNIDITLVIPSSVKGELLAVLKNIDKEKEVFLKNYSSFVSAKSLIDVQSYLSLNTSEEREEYLNRLSIIDRSRYSVVFNFLNNDYTALLNAMDYVSTYVNS